MKILLLSDLHLSMHPLAIPKTDADVVVLAGDLGRPAAALQWARQFERPTLFVAGNHEFYGSDLVTAMGRLRALAKGTRVCVLECDEWRYAGVRFLGCTLWSDYRLIADPNEREFGLRQATAQIRDFSRIEVDPDSGHKFTPVLSQQLFDSSVAWIDKKFAEPHNGPTVVVTHFAPARGSIHPRFADSSINASFVSDLEAMILGWRPQLWLHGHVHDSFDYFVGRTRVVANPRGYTLGGVVENASFDPSLLIDLDEGVADG